MSLGRAQLFAIVCAACAVAPPVSAKHSEPAPELVVRWRIEPAGGGGRIELRADGSGRLHHAENADELDAAAAVDLPSAPARAALVADALGPIETLPRWLHASGTAAGARLWIERNGAVVHAAFGALEAPVEALAAGLATTDPALQRALQPVLDARRGTGAHFRFSAGDARAPLRMILVGAGNDVPLRHLAARIAIDERAFELVPDLHAAFVRSRDADDSGDYFLASSLWRLGDPVGLLRVVDIAGSSRPKWAEEAASDLTACLPEDLVALHGASVTEPERLRGWFLALGERLRFDRASGRYRVAR